THISLTESTASRLLSLLFFTTASTTEIYSLSLHDALPISPELPDRGLCVNDVEHLPAEMMPHAKHPYSRFEVVEIALKVSNGLRSEEHTSELQSRFDLVCRLLLEKKNMLAQPGAEQ